MKNLFKIQLIAMLLLANTVVANNWENYKNFSVVTDLLYANGKTYITAKGGLMIEDDATHQRTFLTKNNSNLPSDLLETILQVSGKSDIFIGTYDNGLAILNNNQITSIPYPANFGLLYDMVEGPGNHIYLQSSNGAFRFNTATHTFTQFNTNSNNVWLYNVWSFDFNLQQNIVVFTGTKFLTLSSATFAVLDSSAAITNPIVTGCTPSAVTLHFINDSTQLLNLGFDFLFLEKNGTTTPANSGLPTNLSNTQVKKAKDGNLYCMVDFSGIYRFDYNTKAWVYLYDLPTNLNAYRFIADRENTIHVTDGGVMLSAFTHSGVAIKNWNTKQYVFDQNNFTKIITNSNGTVQAVSGDIVYEYNSQSNDWFVAKHIPSKYGVLYNTKKINDVFYADNYGKGMIYSNGQTWQWVPHFNADTTYYVYDYDVAPVGDIYFVNSYGLMKYSSGVTTRLISTNPSSSSDWFTHVSYDKNRNILWLSKANKIIKYDFMNTTVYAGANITALYTASVQNITYHPTTNKVYFGCSNNTIITLDNTNLWQMINVPMNSGTQPNFVNQILFYNNKMIVSLSGSTGGFYEFENGNWTYFHPTTQPGLITANISDISVDLSGNYWLAHNDEQGVSVYRTTATGVETISTEKINVYPNPCNHYVYVENMDNSHEDLKLYSINGVQITPDIKVLDGKIEINTSSLSNGMYLIKSNRACAKISVVR